MRIHISIIMENLKQVNSDLLIELGVSRIKNRESFVGENC